MNGYEIGRDFQLLKTRVENLEAFIGSSHHRDMGEAGVVQPSDRVPAATRADVSIWKPEVALDLPPLMLHQLGIPANFLLPIAPIAKTWEGAPEPLIIDVHWATGQRAGTSEEFYRLTGQKFTVVRYEDSTGRIIGLATYMARLKASGRGQSAKLDNTLNGRTKATFLIQLLDNQGGFLVDNGKYLSNSGEVVECDSDIVFKLSFEFPAGLFDAVGGAHWEVRPQTVAYC